LELRLELLEFRGRGGSEEANRIVKNRNAGGSHAVLAEPGGEGLADSDDAGAGTEAPAVELVVEEHFEVGGGVAVLEGEPGVAAVETAGFDGEVGFDVVGLQDVGLDLVGEGRELAQKRKVEGTGFVEEMKGEAEGYNGIGKGVGTGTGAAVGGEDGLDGTGQGEAGRGGEPLAQGKEIFDRPGNGICLNDD
jgi:hypothetical protein